MGRREAVDDGDVCHVGRVKKQLKGGPGGAASEPGLNDFVAMAVGADGLGAGVFDRLVELGHSVTEIRGGQPVVEPEDLVNLRVVLVPAAPVREL